MILQKKIFTADTLGMYLVDRKVTKLILCVTLTLQS